MGAIFKREMKAYFTSPIAYIFLAVFYIITAFYFVNMNLANGSTDMSYVFAGVFVIMMILLPLLTMRLFADEKKLKTDQGLLTAPVNLFEIVMGKFFAATVVFLVGMAIYIPYILVILVSSLTELQIVAAIVSIIINLVLYMIDVIASTVSIDILKKVMVAIGFYNRYTEFTQGILNITSVVFFISTIFIFNFLTVRVLEKRRWS